EMDNGIYSAQRALDGFGIANIAYDKFRIRVQVVRNEAIAMHLPRKTVEDAHGATGGKQEIGHMRADEAGSAGYQDTSGCRRGFIYLHAMQNARCNCLFLNSVLRFKGVDHCTDRARS